MASDDDYTNFLNKANEDPSAGVAKTQQSQAKPAFKATDAHVQIPAPLAQVVSEEIFYTSDSDEPFEAVALGWDEAGKGLPDEEEFASLIQHWEPARAEVDILDPADWDSTGSYTKVVDAVRKAGQGNDVRVYRVARGGVSVEYWVVTTEGKDKDAKLVGLKALAVES